MRLRCAFLAPVAVALLMGLVAMSPAPAVNHAAQEPRDASLERVACRACDGTGQVDATCARCEGSGKGWCAACCYAAQVGALQARGAALLQRKFADDTARELAERKAREAGETPEQRALRGLEELLRSRPTPLTFDLDLTPRPLAQADLAPGRIVCVARCVKGTHHLRDFQFAECRACEANGWIACAACRGKGTSKCGACLGQRRAQGACVECAGAGERAVGGALDVCPWCMDAIYRRCRACGPDGTLPGTCGRCDGAQEVLCPHCAGTRLATCARCRGMGQLKQSGLSGDFVECIDCQRKGRVKCTDCKRGRVECKGCATTGTTATVPPAPGLTANPCAACGGARIVECAGCLAGGGRAWLSEGERHAAAGDLDAGARWFERGIAREEARLGEVRRAAPDERSTQRGLAAEHARELQQLRRRLAALREAPR